MSLAEILFHLNRLNEANELLINGLASQRTVFGDNNFRLIDTYDTLSKVHLAQLQMKAAETDVRYELSIAVSNFGKLNFNVGVADSSLTYVLLKQEKFSEAEKEARTSLKILRATAPPDHQYTASAEYLLASALVGEHRTKEAEPMIRENMARWGRAKAPAWRAARTESLLGAALVQLHKGKEAGDALNHAYQVLSAKDSGSDADAVATAKQRLGEFQHCAAGHHENSCQLSI